MKRRKSKNKIIVASFVIIVLLIIIVLANQFAISDIKDYDYVVQPTHGMLKCEPIGGEVKSDEIPLYESGRTHITCETFGSITTDKCKIYIRVPKLGAFDDVDRIRYKFNYEGEQKIIIDWSSDDKVYYLGDIKPGQGQELEYLYYEDMGLFNRGGKEGASFYAEYKPFGIVRYDTLQGYGDVTKDNCMIPSSLRNNIIKLASDKEEYKNTGYKTSLEPYEKLDYLSKFVIIPDFNLEEYNDQLVFCEHLNFGSTASLIAAERIVTVNGKSYVYPDYSNVVATNLVCCNGERVTDMVCEDHKWVKLGEESCSIFNPCTQRQETRALDKPGYTYHEECINGKCVKKYTKRECTKNSDCESGICRADWTCYDPEEEFCKSDNDCAEGFYCDSTTGQCIPKQKTNNIVLLIAIIMGVIILALIIVIINKKRAQNTGV